MWRVVKQRLKQGYRTAPFPRKEPSLPLLFAGYPSLRACPPGCRTCVDACPLSAIRETKPGNIELDLGACTFCRACERSCPEHSLRFTSDYRMAARSRSDLLFGPSRPEIPVAVGLEPERLKLYRRSFKLRQVCAGGCGACEADANVLGTLNFDMGRFGIQFVASPRHADALLVTGPVTNGMKDALLRTWDALPDPRVVIACGACAISGGPFAGHPETQSGIGDLLPVDLYVPGCPPHPYTLLDAMLRLLNRRQ